VLPPLHMVDSVSARIVGSFRSTSLRCWLAAGDLRADCRRRPHGCTAGVGGPFGRFPAHSKLLEWAAEDFMAYRLCNLFCRLAGNLAPEREVFYQAVGACNETEGMPRGTVYVPLSIADYPPDRKRAVDENIQLSEFFLLLVEDIWEAPVQSFLHDYRLALRCRADAALPMRDIAVFVKKTPEGEEDGGLGQFRAKLGGPDGPRCYDFGTADELAALLPPVLSEWLSEQGASIAAG
jgi:hypothetical protein